MKKETFFILAIIVVWMWMILRTFFWWSNNDWWEIQDSGTWFIEKITNSWENNNETNNQATPIDLNLSWDVSKDNNKDYKEIRVMMPKYFYTAGWKNFAQNLYAQQNIYMNFKFVDNLNEYRDSVTNTNFSWADLMLIPYDWIEDTPTRSFAFQQSLEFAFDQLVSPIVADNQISFLPFAADPMVMYTLPEYTSLTNFSDITNFVYDWVPRNPSSFPLFFWITSEDFNYEWFEREYQDIVRYALMHYFTKYRDSNSLWKWIDSNVFESYNLNTLKTILNSRPNCKNFPSICFQLYNFVWIRFWFMSDEDITNLYFSSKKSDFNKLLQTSLPLSSLESPVRLRWRSMPASLNDNNTINAVYLFLSQYMNKHNAYYLWWSTLSVFAWDNWNNNLMNHSLIWTRWYILSSWWDYMNNIRNTRAFWQLIDYEISAKEYLKKI